MNYRIKFACNISILLILSLLNTSCTNLFFQPLQQHFYTPDVFNIDYDDVYIESDKNLYLHGWKLKSTGEKKGAVLFLHGNGENISTHFANFYWLIEQGYDGYIFDYRGYGGSEGEPEIDGVIRDVDAMLDYLINHTNANQQTIVIGHSMGGALAIHAVANFEQKERLSTLVTVDAFSDYRDITQDVLSKSWLFWLFQWPLSFTIDNSYRPLDAISKVSPVPVLIMHSESDEMIEMYHAERLYEAAKQPKSFQLIEGNHNNVFNKPENRKVLLDYLKTLKR